MAFSVLTEIGSFESKNNSSFIELPVPVKKYKASKFQQTTYSYWNIKL